MLCETVFSDRLNTNPLESCKREARQMSNILQATERAGLRTTVLAPALCPSKEKRIPSIRVKAVNTKTKKGRMTGSAYKTKEIRKSDPQVFPHGLKILLCNLCTSTANLVMRYVVAEANFFPQPADRIRGAQAREPPTLRVPPFLEARMTRRWFSRNRNMTLASLEWEEVA